MGQSPRVLSPISRHLLHTSHPRYLKETEQPHISAAASRVRIAIKSDTMLLLPNQVVRLQLKLGMGIAISASCPAERPQKLSSNLLTPALLLAIWTDQPTPVVVNHISHLMPSPVNTVTLSEHLVEPICTGCVIIWFRHFDRPLLEKTLILLPSLV